MREYTIRIGNVCECPYRTPIDYTIERGGHTIKRYICGHFETYMKHQHEKLIICESKFPIECPFKEATK